MDTRGAARIDTALGGKDSVVSHIHVKVADSSLFEEAWPPGGLGLNFLDRGPGGNNLLDRCWFDSLSSLGSRSRSLIRCRAGSK